LHRIRVPGSFRGQSVCSRVCCTSQCAAVRYSCNFCATGAGEGSTLPRQNAGRMQGGCCRRDGTAQKFPTLRWGVAAVILKKIGMKLEIDYTQVCCVDIYIPHSSRVEVGSSYSLHTHAQLRVHVECTFISYYRTILFQYEH